MFALEPFVMPPAGCHATMNRICPLAILGRPSSPRPDSRANLPRQSVRTRSFSGTRDVHMRAQPIVPHAFTLDSRRRHLTAMATNLNPASRCIPIGAALVSCLVVGGAAG
jgi:hypothetical protein